MQGRRGRPSAAAPNGVPTGLADVQAVERVLSELRSAWGIQFPAVAQVLRALAGEMPVSQESIIRDSGLSYRSVTEVVRRLEPWLQGDLQGWGLEADAGQVVRELVPAAKPPLDDAALLHTITRLVSRAPARRRELDHVVATPETCLRRARFMSQRYALAGAHVVCLGDHDLTSLALALVVPEARVSVVDIDDDVLEYIDRSAREMERSVSCQFADLRLGLPQAQLATADLVFTDPPYTPEGIHLFATRGCQALRRNDLSRLLLCYGYGERQPALGFKAQSALHALRLVSEAIHPRFNQYRYAQAIGSSSALYVLRPVSTTWKAVERETTADARIYSQGGLSTEAHLRPLAEEVQRAVMARLDGSPEPPVLAGMGWTAVTAGQVLSLPVLWRLYERHASSLPAHRPKVPDTVAVSLLESPALAARLLLVNRSRRLLLIVPGRQAKPLVEPGGGLATLLHAGYELMEVAEHAGVTIIEAVRRSDEAVAAGSIVRYLLQHPAATLANGLREAAVQTAQTLGRPLTKNEARALVESDEGPTWHAVRLHDLPLHRLEQVAGVAAVLAESIEHPR